MRLYLRHDVELLQNLAVRSEAMDLCAASGDRQLIAAAEES